MAEYKKVKKGRAFFTIVILMLCSSLLCGMCVSKRVELHPVKSDKPLSNPMVGFAPSADYYEIVKDNTLVYVDVTWREWEPQKGVFDYKRLEQENFLDEWRSKGKQVVFRFVCDIPGDEKHLDIPDWLYEEIDQEGDWYDTDYGQGFSPNYLNKTLIERHRQAIKALGERYGGDDFFCYIELGSLGHWGEWHTKYEDGIQRMPNADVRELYVLPYVEYFPNAMMLMRRPFNPAKEFGLGLFNDMTGLEEDTEEWLNWIENGGAYGETGEENALSPLPEAWKTTPIGGEFTSAISMEQMLNKDIKTTKRLISLSHMTFIGPKCPCDTETGSEYTQGVNSVLSLLGYRLRIKKATLIDSVLQPIGLRVELDWVNDGIAPLYKKWDVYLYLFDQQGNEILKNQVVFDPRSVVDASVVKSKTDLPTRELPDGVYDIGVAIINPTTKQPAIAFAMENTRVDRIYILGQWEKK